MHGLMLNQDYTITKSKRGSMSNYKEGREDKFVNYVIEQMKINKAMIANLRRADNPSTEYQSWGLLASFNIDVDEVTQRLPYCIIGAALAKAKIDKNGTLKLGRAIAKCYDEDKDSEQAKLKLRRLLSCDSTEEVCMILRSLLNLIESKCEQKLNYINLLKNLLWFASDPQRVKLYWVSDFYYSPVSKQEEL